MLIFKILTVIFIVLAFVFALYTFALFPSVRHRKKKEYFKDKRYTAHRGFFNNEEVPENSLTAFKKAIELGYGIELDVRVTKDDKIVVFHDGSTKRICGENKVIEESTYEELQALNLLGTNEKIPLFEEVLSLVNGKVPFIIEVKAKDYDSSKVRDYRVCEGTLNLLKNYDGPWCMESFNPFYVRWFRKNAPEIIRGQLSAKKMPTGKKTIDFALSKMLFNIITRPDFISFNFSDAKKSFPYRYATLLGAEGVSWTIKNEEDLKLASKYFDDFIFENLTPEELNYAQT